MSDPFIEEHLESVTVKKAIEQHVPEVDFPVYIIFTEKCPLCDFPGHSVNSMYVKRWAEEAWIAPCEMLEGWFVLEGLESALKDAEKSVKLRELEESDGTNQGKNAVVPDDMLPDDPVRLGQ